MLEHLTIPSFAFFFFRVRASSYMGHFFSMHSTVDVSLFIQEPVVVGYCRVAFSLSEWLYEAHSKDENLLQWS